MLCSNWHNAPTYRFQNSRGQVAIVGIWEDKNGPPKPFFDRAFLFGGDIFWDLQMAFGDPKRYRHQKGRGPVRMTDLPSCKLLRWSAVPSPRYMSVPDRKRHRKKNSSASARRTYDKRGGAVKTMCNTPPPFRGNISVAHCMPLSTRLKGSRMMSPLLIPEVDRSCPCPGGGIFANLHWNRFIRFWSITFTTW